MNHVKIALAIVLLQSVGQAQIAGINEEKAFRVTTAPNMWHEVIRNQGTVPIVAFRASFHCAGGGPIVNYDALLHFGRETVISPGKGIEIVAGDPSKCPGGIEAVVFSDGHVEGNQEALTEIYSQRNGAYEALGDVIELLNEIPDGRESIAHVIDTLDRRSEASRSEFTNEGVGRTLVYVSVKRVLESSNATLYYRADDARRGIPTISSVIDQNGVTQEVARAMVISKELQAWRSALEGNLEVPGAK